MAVISGKVKSPKAKPQTPPAPDPILLARTVEDLAVDLVDVIPDHNPRKEFDLVELAKLADTIVFHKGLLQPIIVMAKPDGRYDLLAGERRLRAVRDNLGLKVIYARIVTCDEELRAAITDDENRARVQLNPIEAAESLARRFKASGKSQKAFGETVGLSQAEVSNQIRLLGLPDSIKALVISGEIVPSDARSMVTFADLPTVVDAVAKQIAKHSQAGAKIDSGMFRRALADAAYAPSRPVTGTWFDPSVSRSLSIRIDPLTKEIKEALDVRMVPDRWSNQSEPRCFNVEAWSKYQAEYQAGRDAEKAAVKPTEEDEDDEQTDEERAERDAKFLENKIRAYRLKWTQRKIAQWLPTADIVLRTRLLCHFAGTRFSDDDDLEELQAIFAAHGAQLHPMAGVVTGTLSFDYFHALNCDQAEELSIVLLQRWVQEAPDRWATCGMTVEFVSDLADALEIYITDWTIGLEFLELFNDQQLAELAASWKLKKVPKEREALITYLLAQPKLPVPLCLSSVDICEPKTESDDVDENDDDPNFDDADDE